jgi:non-heme chloroperoxidase
MFFVTASDGVKIAVYEYNRSCPETVFLIHGWPLSHKIFEYQIPLLTERGFRVVAIDLRGFGASDAPACGYSYDRMADDVYQVVRRLRLSSFTLTGFSMGGAIALRYMRRFRGFGVKKLILLSAAAPSWRRRPDFPYGLSRKTVDDLLFLAATDRPELARRFSHEQLFACPQSDAAKDWFEDIALSASGIATLQTGFSLRDEDGREDLTAVRVPAWIIHGSKDVVVSQELACYQHEHIPGSVFIHMENSGHGIMYDELTRFNAYFLDAVESSCPYL